MAAKFSNSSSGRALIALAFPLAALVPVAVPFGAAQVASVGLPGAIAGLGQADAATVRKAKRKAMVRPRATTTKVCTTTRIKGRKVIRCKSVKLAPVPPVLVTPVYPPALPPAPYAAPLPMASMQAPPPPLAPRWAPQPHVGPIAYYWIDQADSYAQALGSSPPDFTFNCDGVDCWAWISRDGEVLIVEPGRRGVQQYFFAAHQSAPYLVRDSYNSFAFDGRELAVVYNSEGQVLPDALPGRDRDVAEALHERGRALFAASLRQRRWDRGSATAWIGGYSSLGYYDGWNSGWNAAWRELPEWDRYDRDYRRRRPPRHLDDEHRDRDDARRRYDDWHRRGGQGAPPPTGNPVVTPGDGGGTGQPPVRPPRPMPQPPLPEPPQPVTDTPPPVPSDAPTPRRERPRREIEDEPGVPPVPPRRSGPAPDQPVQIQAQPNAPELLPPAQPVLTWPDPMPGPAGPSPVLVASPDRSAQFVPAPAPAPVAAPPRDTPPPPPPAPAPPPPPREQIVTESPRSDTDRP